MNILEIRLFGGFSIKCEGAPDQPIIGIKGKSLLAFLIAYREQPHTRDFLAGSFWPELTDKAARRRLSQALWQIQRCLSPHIVLQMEADTVQFRPNLPTWIDLVEFSKNFLQGAHDSDQAIKANERCIENYRGEFLTGYYDDWILAEREKLRNLYLVALGRLITSFKRQSRYEEALTYARILVHEDPWSEEGYCEVMRLCHLLGRDAEAKRQFQVCCKVLEEELGVEPSPEIQSLAAEIAKQTGLKDVPWLPASAYQSLTPLLEHPERLPLVGRSKELAGILKQVEAAAQGKGGLYLVYGEAGVGKTRFLQELARNVEWRGIRAVWCRCYELAGSPVYQPIVEIFRSGIQALIETSLEPLWRAELARFLPELATGEAPPALNPEGEQHRLLEAIARGFQMLSEASPSLIILEDAHWMDPASLNAIRYVLPRLAGMRLLMVISARRAELSGLQAEVFSALGNTRLPHHLELSGLDIDETGELVQRCLNLEEPPAKFSARLNAETQGNPFFLIETLRALSDEGLLYLDEMGRWSTPWDESTTSYAEMPLPGSVIQSIELRLDRLPATLIEPLNLAAVIGRGVSFNLWLQSTDLPETELLAVGDELCRRGLLIRGEPGPVTNAGAIEDYVFFHDQIRRVTYDRLARPRRRILHRRVAEALYCLAPERVEALAYHWTAAGVWDMAVECHQKAGKLASAVYANAEAIEHYTKALDAMERLPGTPNLHQIYEIRLDLEKIYDLQGARQAQTQALTMLAEIADVLDDNKRRAEVALRRARQAEITSDFPPAIEAASYAVHLARAVQDVTIETESHMEWGWALLLQGEHLAAQAQFEQALSLAQQVKDRRLEADGLHGLGTVCLVTCDYSQAKVYFQQVLSICKQIDIRKREGSTLANLGYIATAQGDHAAGNAYNEQALRIHRETGDTRGAALVMENLATEFLAEGDFAKSKAYLEDALCIQKEIQAHENVGVSLRSLGSLFHQLGDFSRAKEYYEKALAIFNELGIRWYQGQALAYLSLLSHHMGNDRAAQEQSLQGLGIAKEIGDRLAQGWLLDASGHALAGLRQLDQAEQAYRQALTLRRELEDKPQLTTESLAGLARLAFSQENLPAARDLVEEILSIQKAGDLDGVNEPFRIQWTCYQVLKACQDPRADEILANAYEQLVSLKANIKDETLERTFFQAIVANREIIAAYLDRKSQQLGTKVQIKLPKSSAPSGRPLREDESIMATWTVTAPEDKSIPDKAARRRHCLLRLLEEAQLQGAAPSYDHLAQALGVTRRTIERDMAFLREQNENFPALRGTMSE